MKKLMLFLCLVLSGCGGAKMGVAPPPVLDPPPPVKSVFTSISISASSQFVQPGYTQQFTATALDQNQKPMTGITFSWFSNVPSVATIDGHGLVTAVANGYSGIFATAGKLSSVVTLVGGVNKGQKIPAPPVPTKLVVSPSSLALTVNQSQTLTATWFDQYGQVVSGYAEDFWEWYPNASPITVRNDPEIIRIDNLVANGTVTTSWSTSITGLKAGTVELNTCGGSCNGLTAPKGDGQIYSNVVPVTVTADKVTTPPSCQPPQTLINGVCETPKPKDPTTLSITSSENPLYDGDTAQLTAAYSLESQYGNQVSWTSSNPAVATVVSTGTFTATLHAVSCVAGSAMITATGTDVQNTSLSATLVVTTALHDPVLATITVSPASVALVKNQSVPFSAVGRDKCGSVMSVPFDWNVTGSATITQNGVATGTGTSGAQVTASSDGITSPASTMIVAAYGATASVVLSPAPYSLQVPYIGPASLYNEPLTASAVDAYNNPVTNETFTWSSTQPSVATANSTGQFTAQVSAVSTGVTQIVAVASDGVTSSPATVPVTNDTPNLTTVVVSPNAPIAPQWSTQGFTALAYDQNNALVNPQPTFQWITDNGSVATIDQSGLASTINDGTVNVIATAQDLYQHNVSGSGLLTVSLVNPVKSGNWTFALDNGTYLDTDLQETEGGISSNGGFFVVPSSGFSTISSVSGTNANDTITLTFDSFTLIGSLSGQQMIGTWSNSVTNSGGNFTAQSVPTLFGGGSVWHGTLPEMRFGPTEDLACIVTDTTWSNNPNPLSPEPALQFASNGFLVNYCYVPYVSNMATDGGYLSVQSQVGNFLTLKVSYVLEPSGVPWTGYLYGHVAGNQMSIDYNGPFTWGVLTEQ